MPYNTTQVRRTYAGPAMPSKDALTELGFPSHGTAFWNSVQRIRRAAVLDSRVIEESRHRGLKLPEIAAVFAAQVVARFPKEHAAALALEAEAALFNWIVFGPTSPAGAPRSWNPEFAVLALQRHARRLPKGRLKFDAPRSLWRQAVAVCERRMRKLAPDTPAPVVLAPAKVRPVTGNPAAWRTLSRSFAEHVATTRARMTANVGNAEHVAALVKAALAAVTSWVGERARRTQCDLPAALMRRTERAKLAEVSAFTYWPASLLRAVRRALDLVAVVRVTTARTVRVTA